MAKTTKSSATKSAVTKPKSSGTKTATTPPKRPGRKPLSESPKHELMIALLEACEGVATYVYAEPVDPNHDPGNMVMRLFSDHERKHELARAVRLACDLTGLQEGAQPISNMRKIITRYTRHQPPRLEEVNGVVVKFRHSPGSRPLKVDKAVFPVVESALKAVGIEKRVYERTIKRWYEQRFEIHYPE